MHLPRLTLTAPPQAKGFGLDISDDALKILQLSGTTAATTIDVIDLAPLSAGKVVAGEIIDVTAVATVLRRMVDQYKRVLAPGALLALPETKTFTQSIIVPKKKNNTFSEQLQNVLPEYLPHALNEVYFDAAPISETDREWIALVGAAPKSVVDPYLELFEAAHVLPIALDVEAAAIATALVPPTSPNTRAIINLGRRRASLILHDKGVVQFTLSLPIAGEAITQELQQELAITREQAEKTKRLCGLDPKKCEGVLRKILETMVQQLVDRIEEGRKYYRDHFSESGDIKEILLSGGGAHLVGLDTVLSETLGIPVRRPSLWEYATPIKVPELESELRFAVALGLSLRALKS